MSISKPPVKHHFIPRFLLAHWAQAEGKLWRFSSPVEGKVASKLVSPAEVGYGRDLYATPGVSADRRQWFEQLFMSPLDAQAADAHQMLLSGMADGMRSRERSAWSRFIMSLWFRTPAGVRDFKVAMAHILEARDELLEARYAQVRMEGYPDTLAAWIASMEGDFMERVTMDLLRRMSDDPNIGARLNGMRWSVVDVSSGGDLLISDAALQHSAAGAFTENGYLMMPTAPDRLFVAANRQAIMDALRGISAASLVRQINEVVVRRAADFVGATDRTMEPFIVRNFGTEVNETYIKALADIYREAATGRA